MSTDAPWANRIVGYGEEPPDQLLANPFNFRRHPAYQQKAMAGVLKQIGVIQNVIVNKRTGHMVDGHLRVELSLRDGQPVVPITYVDLSEEEEKLALATFDPLSALAIHDTDAQRLLLADIRGENASVSELLDSMRSSLGVLKPKGDPDEIPEIEAHVISQTGDVWTLGNHRVICGDSTNPKTLSALMGGMADMVWTDPPYNVDYQGGNGQKIANDSMPDAKFRQFLRELFSSACSVMADGAPIYIAHADSEGINFRSAMVESGFLLKQCLVWVKSALVLGRQDYQWQHEPILYGWKPGAAHRWYGDRNKTTVLEESERHRDLDKPALHALIKKLRNALNATVIEADKPSSSTEHPTMKPVALIEHMVRNSTLSGDIVLDVCGGSGSTLMACELAHRAARLCELDPRYVDVIVRRWEIYAHLDAVLESTGQTFAEVAAARA